MEYTITALNPIVFTSMIHEQEEWSTENDSMALARIPTTYW
jgi:hypothetical protein